MSPDAPDMPNAHEVAGAPEEPRETWQRGELVTVLVLSLTAILTAWAGFQAAKWGGRMSISFSEASAARTESVRETSIAGQQIAVDVDVFSSWADAVAADDSELAEFYRDRFTDRLEPAVDAWLATEPLTAANAPESPFEMPEYVVEHQDRATELEQVAGAAATDALTFNQRSDNYVIMSVLFASVLFFAAISGKLRSSTGRRVLLGLAIVGFVVGAIVVSTFPVEI